MATEDDVKMSKEDDEEENVKMSDEENSDDSDGDEEMVDDAKIAEKLSEIDQKLRQNPFDYQSHVDKIALLKSSGELDGLRKARETFSELYPLTPTIWLDWISDERNLATSEEEKSKVCELFERAVKDYVSVEVWLEYCQFFIGTADGMTKSKDIFERGIASVGVHVSKGALLWEAYREFENALLSMQPGNVDQFEKVDKIFRRQLAVPLLDMENTFTEYSDWMSSVDIDSPKKIDPNVERQFKTALAMLAKREGFENELASCEGEEEKSLAIYDRYLAFEKKEGNPARIQCLFERRVTDHCLQPKVWIEYLDYLERQLKMGPVSLPVFERSIRNCTWNSDLWIKFMRAKERYGCEKAEILKLSEQALSAGFVDPADYCKIWLAYIDFLRRRLTEDDKEQFTKDREEIRLLFGRSLEHVTSLGGDPDCTLARYWASMEADRFRSTEEARKIWTDILAVLGNRARFWLEQVQLEKSFGDTKHIRRVFQRAIERVKDFPETICEAWLQFEREEGTLEQFEDAEAKIKTRLEKLEVERAKLRESEHVEVKRKEEKIEKKKVKDLEKRREKRRTESETKKRKIDPHEAEAQKNNEEPCFKKPFLAKTDMPPPPPGLRAQGAPPPGFKGEVAPPPGFKNDVAPPPGFKNDVAPPPGFKNDVAPPPGFKEPSTPAAPPGHVHDDAEKQIRTVFLSNLDFSVEAEPIERAMSKSGKVVEVRLVRNPVGKSKGFAFVEFATEREARSALGRDREMFEGRPLFISECDPEKKTKGSGHDFKFGTGLEKNKLFVKDLSKDTSREHLEEIFGKFGPLKEVRLITFRNGHSKGLAFVEFSDEVSAAKALIKTDGMEIDGKAISVAISNPPAKKVEPSRSDVRSLGGGAKEVGARGRGRTQVSFVPRALAVKTPASSTGVSKSGNGNVPHPEAGNSGATKSNQDFRNMLLGKK